LEAFMNFDFSYTAADREFYAPLENARDDGEVFRPSRVPDGWRGVESGVWTVWHWPEHADIVDEGWKVHVSARPERLQHVLDIAAGVCFEYGVPFKHMSTRLFYWWTHQKYAHRSQGGKFIAAYPADVDAARRLMERLREELADEDGPYIFTDRRFKDSRTVYYRYGAYRSDFRVEAAGTRTLLVRDNSGRLVPDRRGASFQLPEGIVDPFTERELDGASPTDLGGFAIDSSVRYTNAGGTYRGREIATGRRVFIKEGRPHIGVRDDGATATEQLREEWETLTALHALAPGLAPEPISYFRVWEHEFMAVEHVEGRLLTRWMSINSPMLRAGTTVDDFEAYYDRCEKIMSAIEAALDRLHTVGYIFVDVSPGNVVVADDDAVRLIDFGSAHRLGGPFLRAGTPGFVPPDELVGDDLAMYDHFGVSRLAGHLLGPLHFVLNLNPGVLAHQRYDLSETAPIRPALWKRATKYHVPGDDRRFPTPEQVAADPVRHLTELRGQVADALVAMADVDHPERVFPTIPEGYASNTVCLAYGTAGVVHALRRADRPLPEGLLDRLRRDALSKAGELGPGLYVGTAGTARVLSDCGLLDEARDLLAAADRHPLTGECATLFGGAAGVALTHLALYGHTRDEHHVDRALALAAALPPDDALTPWLGPNDATGLMHGRCGVALMLQQLAGVTGEDRQLTRAVRLLHAELDRASVPDAAGLLFPVSATDRRAMPYLFAGAAGMAYATTRCLRAVDDERLAEALPRLLAPLHLGYTVMSGLFSGTAGYAFTLADHAAVTGDEASRQASLRAARRLFKYAVSHRTGMRYLGDQLLRFSAELWSGSAGVLLALAHVLDPRADALFTVDALVDERRSTAWQGAELVAAPIPATAR
jgi:hypothetical protein